MMGRQQIGEGVMGGTNGTFQSLIFHKLNSNWYRKVNFHVVSGIYVSTSNLYWHLFVAGCQCNSRNIPEICSCLIVSLLRCAAAFCAICCFFVVPTVKPLIIIRYRSKFSLVRTPFPLNFLCGNAVPMLQSNTRGTIQIKMIIVTMC